MYAFVTLTDCNKPRGLIKTVTQTKTFDDRSDSERDWKYPVWKNVSATLLLVAAKRGFVFVDY